MAVEHGVYLGRNVKPWQKIEEISSTLKYPLGSYFDDDDMLGRRFRYSLNGAGALVAGDIVQSAALGGAGTELQAACAVAVAADADAKRVYITAVTTAQTASIFAEGLAAIYDASLVASYIRRIKDNTAIAASGVASYIDLYDGVPVALTTSDFVAIMTNPYYKIIQAPTTLTGKALGGVLCAVTAAYYCWVQTKGWFATHIKDGNLPIGPVTNAGTTAGTLVGDSQAVAEAGTASYTVEDHETIGISNAAWNDEKSGFVYLNCE